MYKSVYSLCRFVLLMTFFYSSIGYAQLPNYNGSYYPAGLHKSLFTLWFDASDSSSFEFGSQVTNGITSKVVNKWLDKSLKPINAINLGSSALRPFLLDTMGKKIVTFRGNKVLILTDDDINDKLDSPNGHFLIQSVYVFKNHVDLNDYRVSTISRVQTNGVGVSSVGYSLRFPASSSTNSLKIVVGSMVHGSTFIAYSMDSKFKDIRNRWNILEHNSYKLGGFWGGVIRADGLLSLPFNYDLGNQLGSYSKLNVGLGNRVATKSVNWGIGETILLGKTASESECFLLRTYMACKWSDTIQLAKEYKQIFRKIPPSFRNRISGIYYWKKSDFIDSVAQTNGLSVNNFKSKPFLRDKEDFILIGDNNKIGGFTSITPTVKRLARTWYLVKQDKGNVGGVIELKFKIDDIGTSLPNFSVSKHYALQFSDVNENFNSSTVIPFTSSTIKDRVISFHFNSEYIKDGYYSLLEMDSQNGFETIVGISQFSIPVIQLTNYPIIKILGVADNYLSFETMIDSMGYEPTKILLKLSYDNITIDKVLIFNPTYNVLDDLPKGKEIKIKVISVDDNGTQSAESPEYRVKTALQYLPLWHIEPQWNGNATSDSIIMQGKLPFNLVDVEFQFKQNQLIDDWQIQSYKKYKIQKHQPYTFQYRVRLKSNRNFVSEWSEEKLVSTSLDSMKGGFNYQWVRFIQSDSSDYGLGPVVANYLSDSVCYIKHAPPYGVHPRIYCNPEDRLTIKNKLKNTVNGRQVRALLNYYTTLLVYGVSKLTTNERTEYGKYNYSTNIPLFDRAALLKRVCEYNLNDIDSILYASNNVNVYGRFLHQLSLQAFECWVFSDEVDPKHPKLALYGQARADTCIKALLNIAKRGVEYYAQNTNVPKVDKNMTFHIGFAYDFIQPFLNSEQTNIIRKFLAINVPAVNELQYGFCLPSVTRSNWATFGYEMFANLAIEGEDGFKRDVLDFWSRTAHNFMMYGIYPNGVLFEGTAKNQVNLALLYALARRGYSMLTIPSVKAFASDFLPNIIQPFGYGFYTTDYLGGTTLTLDNTSGDAATGDRKFSFVDMVALKKIFPLHLGADYSYRNFIQRRIASDKDGYYYSQLPVENTYFNTIIPAAILTEQYTSKGQVWNEKTDYFDPYVGHAHFRNNIDSLGAKLIYFARQNFGGHNTESQGNFSYSDLGRIWIPLINSRTKSHYAELNNTFTVDGIATKNPSSGDKVPSKIIEYNEGALQSSVASDLTEYFSKDLNDVTITSTEKYSIVQKDVAEEGFNEEPWIKSFDFYSYKKIDLPPYNQSLHGFPHWRYNSQTVYNRLVKYRPISKVYRTISLIKSPRPYVLLADDIVYDAISHKYNWYLQLPYDLVSQNAAPIVSTDPFGNFTNDFIYQERNGTRKLLIRLIDADINATANNKPYIFTDLTPNITVPRYSVESNGTKGRLKLLIYAFDSKMTLPNTRWDNSNAKKLIIEWPDLKFSKQVIDFTESTKFVGKSNIVLDKQNNTNSFPVPFSPIR